MKLNLDKNVVGLRGEPINEKLSDVLANILAMSTMGKPAKMITWAVNLTNYGEIEVNEEDVNIIKQVVENDRFTINLAKAQILEELDKLIE